MMTTPVSRAEAIRLGLLPEKGDQSEEADFLHEINQPQDRSFNRTLQARPAIASQPIRDALAQRLQGFAEWQGDTLIFTDPNGTRPGTAEEVARWITSPLPIDSQTGKPFPLNQGKALAKWAEDHADFSREQQRDGSMKEADIPWGSNRVEDLMRSVLRVRPYTSGPVWRGMAFRDAVKWKAFVANLKKSETYEPLKTKLLDSFSVAESGARKYASKGDYRVILEVTNPKSAREIAPQVRALVERAILQSRDPKHPLPTDGEAVYVRGVKFRVLRVVKVSDREAKIYIEEVSR